MSTSSDVVVVSNRGPLSFRRTDGGKLEARRGGGGLITAIGPGVDQSGATWVAAAISDDDREAAARGRTEAEGLRVHMLTLDPDDYRAYYDGVANSVLWYVYHGMFDRPRRPSFDRHFVDAWERFRRVNDAFAETVVEAAPEGAAVLVQDYHLALMGRRLAAARPDLRTVHFNHTPFCGPEGIRLLPDDVASELLENLTAFGSCGFHSRRWADAFEASCEAVLGRRPATFVSPAAADANEIKQVAATDACQQALASLENGLGGRRFLVRVDRIELSKNILRGFTAFDDLLANHPEWREQVVFGAFVYPSRLGLPDYQAYAAEAETLVTQINRRWSTPDWTPIMIDLNDDFPLSVAALRRADAVLVNPIRDGLNLVAKEATIVNERDAGLVLSRESGVWDELGEFAYGVNPYDIVGTSDAIHAALSASTSERSDRAAALRAAATRRTPLDWFNDQVDAAS